MAIFNTQIDKIAINYEQVARYTLNVSFNGIEGAINDAKITVFIPISLEYTIGQLGSEIQSVLQESVTGGTRLTFNFGSIQNLGIAVTLRIEVQFGWTTPVGTSFNWEAELWINGSVYSTATTDALTLEVVPNFQLDIHAILPLTQPAAGGQVIMKVELENYGDQGAEIVNTLISCQIPDGGTLDTSFDIIGSDISIAPYQDTQADGIEGTIVGNGFTFTIPAYRGQKYSFMYRYTIDSNLEEGHQLENIATWSIDEITQDPGMQILTLATKTYQASINKYGPAYTVPEEYISYELYMVNNGNQALVDVSIKDEIPPEVNVYEFWTGTFWIESIQLMVGESYTISYTTQNGTTGTLGPFNTNINTRVDVTTLIGSGDQLSILEWMLSEVAVGVKQRQAPIINGIVLASTTLGTTILNHFECGWDENGGRQYTINNQVAMVQDLCILYPQFTQIQPNTDVRPGDYIIYELTLDCSQSRLENPRIAAFIPSTLEYIEMISLTYEDYFQSGQTFPAASVQVVPQFNGTNDTLIKITYEGSTSFTCRQRSKLKYRFKAQVAIGASGTASMGMLLNTASNNGVVPTNIDIYRDNLDIAGTGQANLIYAKSTMMGNTILFTTSIASDKKVKGALDLVYSEVPTVGRTVEGGMVEYMMTMMNTGNVDIYSIEIVDILPHIGDTGVVTTSQSRGSEFPVYNINGVQATISPLYEGQQTPILGIMYSQSYNPIRFGSNFDTIGIVNDWTTTMPAVATEIRSIKISTQNTLLYPGQSLSIKIQGIAVIGTPVNQTAWNSFAAQVSYIDEQGTRQYLLAIEPEKVGVRIETPSGDVGGISGRVFEDSNKNGLLEVGELGIDDIALVLYDEQFNPMAAVFTTPNINGESGYYAFSNLPKGKYYIRAIRDELLYKFSPQRLEETGSKVDSKLGITNVIDLNSDPYPTTIYVGLIRRTTADRIDEILQVNTSAKKMLRNATYNQLLISMKLEDTKKLIEEGN